jgi:hypothetical protein
MTKNVRKVTKIVKNMAVFALHQAGVSGIDLTMKNISITISTLYKINGSSH